MVAAVGCRRSSKLPVSKRAPTPGVERTPRQVGSPRIHAVVAKLRARGHNLRRSEMQRPPKLGHLTREGNPVGEVVRCEQPRRHA